MKITIEVDDGDIRDALREWNRTPGAGRVTPADFRAAIRARAEESAGPDAWPDILEDLASQAD